MTKSLFRFFVIFFFLGHYSQSYAQDSVYSFQEANVKLNIPNSHWHLQPKQVTNGFTVYIFKRDPILDSSSRNIIPNAAVVIEDIDPKIDVVTYSVNKRAGASFSVTKMFTHEDGTIHYLNAVGYKGTYTDEVAHTIYVVHAINGNKGMQLILDTTSETFLIMDPEFLQILKSFRKS